MTRDERTYKLKLLAREPSQEMAQAFDDARFANPDHDHRFVTGYRAMHAAAPNDETKRLIRVLRRALESLNNERYAPFLRADIKGLLEDLGDD